jgi:hypothetical protein
MTLWLRALPLKPVTRRIADAPKPRLRYGVSSWRRSLEEPLRRTAGRVVIRTDLEVQLQSPGGGLSPPDLLPEHGDHGQGDQSVMAADPGGSIRLKLPGMSSTMHVI